MIFIMLVFCYNYSSRKRLKKLIVAAAADLNGSSDHGSQQLFQGLKQEPGHSWVEPGKSLEKVSSTNLS